MSSAASDSPPVRDTLRNRLLAGVLTATFAFFRVVPAFIAYGIADLCAPVLAWRTARRADRIHSEGRGMRRNAEIVFRDELTPIRLRNLYTRWARHLTYLMVDFARMPRITVDTYEKHVDEGDISAVDELTGTGDGVLFISGHIGHWELLGHSGMLRGTPMKIVARPLESPAVEAAVNRIRMCAGLEVAGKWGVLWSLFRELRRGHSIGLLVDEDVRDSELFVPFLGTQASANVAVAHLHMKTRAPIIVASAARVGRMRFQLHVWGVIRHAESDDYDADVVRVTTEFNEHLSRAILAYPHQWFWGSRRFHTRPPGEQPGADGLPPTADGDREFIREAARALD